MGKALPINQIAINTASYFPAQNWSHRPSTLGRESLFRLHTVVPLEPGRYEIPVPVRCRVHQPSAGFNLLHFFLVNNGRGFLVEGTLSGNKRRAILPFHACRFISVAACNPCASPYDGADQ